MGIAITPAQLADLKAKGLIDDTQAGTSGPPAVDHKYGAVRSEVDGIKFASRAEAKRYVELRILEAAGKISNLRLQVPYMIVIQSKYVADFVYMENGKEVVEDVKGYKTREYKRKKRLLKEQWGIEIKET